MNNLDDKFLRVKIPDNAKLKDIIYLLNELCIEVNVNLPNKERAKWIYEHRDWLVIDEDGK